MTIYDISNIWHFQYMTFPIPVFSQKWNNQRKTDYKIIQNEFCVCSLFPKPLFKIHIETSVVILLSDFTRTMIFWELLLLHCNIFKAILKAIAAITFHLHDLSAPRFTATNRCIQVHWKSAFGKAAEPNFSFASFSLF